MSWVARQLPRKVRRTVNRIFGGTGYCFSCVKTGSAVPNLNDPMKLPCGAILPNRLAKAAVTEGLADARGWVTPELEGIYADWAHGGFGLLVSGNIIVDGDHLERPGNVVIDGRPSDQQMAVLRSWAATATAQGSQFWAQLSHSGRQTPRMVNARPKSPSAVRMGLPAGLFGKPQAMTAQDIEAVIERFASAARVCKAAGFTGVQIHAAHGYLLASFLSPRANQRTDRWGGALENRSRLLERIVEAVRAAVGPSFPIGVKLNSADFQRGGFEAWESEAVAMQLTALGVDLIEVSGGDYERPRMIGIVDQSEKPSTIAREAYFIEFARALRNRSDVPIMLTGGLRTRAGMEAALAEGIDVLGLGRPACIDPYCAGKILAGEVHELDRWEQQIKRDGSLFGARSPIGIVRTLNSFASIYWFYAQILRAGHGEAFAPGMVPMVGLLRVQAHEFMLQQKRKGYLRKAKPAPTAKVSNARADIVLGEQAWRLRRSARS